MSKLKLGHGVSALHAVGSFWSIGAVECCAIILSSVFNVNRVVFFK